MAKNQKSKIKSHRKNHGQNAKHAASYSRPDRDRERGSREEERIGHTTARRYEQDEELWRMFL